MDVRKITLEAEAAKWLIANIMDIIGDDEVAVRDAIDGETGLMEAIDAALYRMREVTAIRNGIDDAAAALRARAERLDRQIERIRTTLESTIGDLGLKTIERPMATLSLARSPDKVMIVSEADIPSAYLVEKTTIAPDKKAILASLKAGAKIPGTELSNGGATLRLKWS